MPSLLFPISAQCVPKIRNYKIDIFKQSTHYYTTQSIKLTESKDEEKKNRSRFSGSPTNFRFQKKILTTQQQNLPRKKN